MNFINTEIEQYCVKHSAAEDSLMTQVNRDTHLKNLMPRMLSGALQGSFLTLLANITNAKTIVEFGTFTGYSALCLAKGMHKEGKLITLDNNEELQTEVVNTFKQSGYSIEFRLRNILEEIENLPNEIDLLFIDADKENYLNYYKAMLPKMRVGGLMVADNVLWSGKVIDEKANDFVTNQIRSFNDFVAADNGVHCSMLPVRDGLLLITKL